MVIHVYHSRVKRWDGGGCILMAKKQQYKKFPSITPLLVMLDDCKRVQLLEDAVLYGI